MKKKAVATSTYKARKSQWKCYERFCCKFDFVINVLLVDVICLYIVFLSQFMSFGAVSTYVHGLPFMCHIKGIQAPDLTHPQVKLTLNGVKRTCSRPLRRRDPIDLKLLKIIFKHVNFHSNKWLSFWAACITMFRCLLRISNIILSPHSIRVRDVEFTEWGCLVTIHSSKCSVPGVPHVLPISLVDNPIFCPVYWLKLVISRCKLSPNDYLFCEHPGG